MWSSPHHPPGAMALPQVLIERYRRLFSFYDRDGDGLHRFEQDFAPVARSR